MTVPDPGNRFPMQTLEQADLSPASRWWVHPYTDPAMPVRVPASGQGDDPGLAAGFALQADSACVPLRQAPEARPGICAGTASA